MMNNLKKDYIVAIGGSNVDILGKMDAIFGGILLKKWLMQIIGQ